MGHVTGLIRIQFAGCRAPAPIGATRIGIGIFGNATLDEQTPNMRDSMS